jgi:hypothetical protein
MQLAYGSSLAHTNNCLSLQSLALAKANDSDLEEGEIKMVSSTEAAA